MKRCEELRMGICEMTYREMWLGEDEVGAGDEEDEVEADGGEEWGMKVDVS
jgi:hypothetical protein